MRGKFIVLEGLDGAGLSTQSVLLENHLKLRGLKTMLTKEPTNGLLGGIIKASLKGEWKTSYKSLQLLFCADRAHHLENEIEPALLDGRIVISDRYLFSTLAYGYASNVNYKWLRYINLNFRLPDLAILLDVTADTSLSRISGGRSNLELFEHKEKLSKVRQAYLHAAKEFHIKVVDGNGSIADAESRIDKIVNKFLSLR